MIIRTNIVLLAVLASLSGCTRTTEFATPDAADSPADSVAILPIRGKVLDGNGEPVDDVEVATFWSANGQQWNDDGSFPELESAGEDVLSEFWNDEGVMVAAPIRRASQLVDGKFNIKATGVRPHIVLAINGQQTLGGLAYASRQPDEQLSIKLEPLVRVVGEIRCDGEIPDWTYACVYPGTLKQVPD